MLKIAIVFAALAAIGFVVPTMQTANAETTVIKKDGDHDHDRDWGRRHHKKVVIIKHRGHRDHDHD